MSKKEKIAKIRRIWAYLANKTFEAYEARDEAAFDWYNDGKELFWQALSGLPVKTTPRVKPLR